MSNKIVKSFGKKTSQQIEAMPLSLTISWQKMIPHLVATLGFTSQNLEGIIADETGIKIIIGKYEKPVSA